MFGSRYKMTHTMTVSGAAFFGLSTAVDVNFA